MRMELELLLPPNLANDGGRQHHWRKEHRARGRYFEKLDLLQLAKQLPRPPATAPQRVRITAHLYLWSLMDEDNAMARLKWPVDWLRTRGYIADDRRKNIEWAGLPEQTVDRKRQRLVLVIEDATPTAGG